MNRNERMRAVPDTIQEMRRAFDSFMSTAKKDPTAGSDLLNEAYEKAEAALEGELTRELAHLAHDIFYYKGKRGWAKRVQLHRRYLKSDLDDSERLWSHWEMIDALAALERNKETVKQQERLYRWALSVSPHEYALKALDDTSHARCWEREGRLDDWFQLYNEAAQNLNSPKVSLYRRCCFLQGGMEVCMMYGRLDEALRYQAALEKANDDPDWKDGFSFWLACVSNRLLVHGRRAERELFEEAAAEARAYIDRLQKKQNAGEPIDTEELRWTCHDVGSCMFRLGRYQEAVDFLTKAIETDDILPDTHYCLAASLWAGEKDRCKALHHLKIAADFMLNQSRVIAESFLNEHAFADVQEDAEFRAAAGLD